MENEREVSAPEKVAIYLERMALGGDLAIAATTLKRRLIAEYKSPFFKGHEKPPIDKDFELQAVGAAFELGFAARLADLKSGELENIGPNEPIIVAAGGLMSKALRYYYIGSEGGEFQWSGLEPLMCGIKDKDLKESLGEAFAVGFVWCGAQDPRS